MRSYEIITFCILVEGHKGNLLFGTLNRIVIPESLQDRAIILAHEEHKGIAKTKRLLRERVWFPNIDKKIENLLFKCTSCQLNNKGNKPED